jgi:hypothetical protein
MPVTLWPHDTAILSRRAAMGSLAGIGLAATLGRASTSAEAPPWYALVSDTHIAADPKATNLKQTMAENLRATIVDILAQPSAPQGVVIDGDLALKNGQPGDYATLLGLLDPLRRAGIPIHMGLGNHDDRAHFRAALSAQPPVDATVLDRHVTVVQGPGVRLVLLDSLDQTDVTPGVLGERQLGWLARTLDSEAETPTMLFVHHNLTVLKGGLSDTPALLAMIWPRRQVKAVIYGHSHQWMSAREPIGQVHLVNLPAVAYAFHEQQPLGWVRCAVKADGVEMELRCIGGDPTKDRQRLDLAWRKA